MATRIRLRRMGSKGRPFYRVVVADQRAPRDGRFIENIGKYHPLNDPSVIEIDEDRALHWLRVGAQPSEQVRNLMTKIGIWEKFVAERPSAVAGSKASKPERAAKEKVSKKAQAKAAEAAKAPAEAKAPEAAASAAEAAVEIEAPAAAEVTPDAPEAVEAPAAAEVTPDAPEAVEAPAAAEITPDAPEAVEAPAAAEVTPDAPEAVEAPAAEETAEA